MKQIIMPALKLTAVMLVLCSVIYFSFVSLVAKAAPGQGNGEQVKVNKAVVGYDLIGQQFTDEKYFWGRPSAVDYNAGGSAGSNKGPSNPEYLALTRNRLDKLLKHHPGIQAAAIPAEMITASGSGLDPHLSPASAYFQVGRISRARGLDEKDIKRLVEENIERNLLGPDVVNVLKLNITLDKLNR